MERVAILFSTTPGWSNKLDGIVHELQRGRITDLTIYVDDGSMQHLVQDVCKDNSVDATVLLWKDRPDRQITDNWQIGLPHE